MTFICDNCSVEEWNSDATRHGSHKVCRDCAVIISDRVTKARASKIILPIAIQQSLEIGELDAKKAMSPTELVHLSARIKGTPPGDAVGGWVDYIFKETYGEIYGLFIPALIVPFTAGDCVDDRFDSETDFLDGVVPNPPVIYNHGNATESLPEADTAIIGQELERWKTESGLMALIGIYADVPRLQEILAAWQAGTLGFSTTTLLQKRDVKDVNLIRSWLIGEISIVLPGSGFRPCDLKARAADYATSVNALTPALQAKLDSILSLQPEELRDGITSLVLGGSSDLPLISDSDAPASNGSASDLSTFEEDDEMKPEEIKKLVDEQLAAAGISPNQSKKAEGDCGCGDAEAKMKKAVEDAIAATQKACSEAYASKATAAVAAEDGEFDPLAHLAAKSKATVETSADEAKAAETVELYIKSGRLDVTGRVAAIGQLKVAIAESRRSKSSKPIDDVLALFGALRPGNGNSLKAFGYQGGEQPTEPNKDRIAKQAAAAMGAINVGE